VNSSILGGGRKEEKGKASQSSTVAGKGKKRQRLSSFLGILFARKKSKRKQKQGSSVLAEGKKGERSRGFGFQIEVEYRPNQCGRKFDGVWGERKWTIMRQDTKSLSYETKRL